jgi:SAM-dependent methyltransferase
LENRPPGDFIGTANEQARRRYLKERSQHWDKVARREDGFRGLGGAYHRRLHQVYRFLVPPGQRVLELGCGTGDLLASLRPRLGVGLDLSFEMVRRASLRHPDLVFLAADAHMPALTATFDFIILSDLVNDAWDVQEIFEALAPFCGKQTRVIINTHSRLWELPLMSAEILHLARPTLPQNWLVVEDIQNLLNLAGFELFRHWREFVFPFDIPLITPLFNRFLARFWPLDGLALTNFIVARPHGAAQADPPGVSVIVPARNEAGNIPAIFARTPEMGAGTELVFVEGHSKDDTYTAIEREMELHPDRRCRLLRQTGTGKGDAVRLGFTEAGGDVLMILDADLTVPPEDLPRFYTALVSGKGEFVNGVRLVYPMEQEAMRFLNFLGNKFFSLAFSWLLGQPIKDTLCGTKVLWKSAYELIASNRAYFGDFDPFGDFDLLFGAARLNLKIVDLPIRYRERTYGTTNIQRWRHGWLLIKMVTYAALRIKFI